MIVHGKTFQPKHKIIKCGFNNNLDKDKCMYDLLKKTKEMINKDQQSIYFGKRDRREKIENGNSFKTEDIVDLKELNPTDKKLIIFL